MVVEPHKEEGGENIWITLFYQELVNHARPRVLS